VLSYILMAFSSRLDRVLSSCKAMATFDSNVRIMAVEFVPLLELLLAQSFSTR